ncbi:hypothetical protein AMTRI_Chr06g196920 [Amborella trichopoda]
MKLFVFFPHSCQKFCTGGSSESIQKRELYFNNFCAFGIFRVYICITVTDLPPDALTVDFCIVLAFFTFTGENRRKTLIDFLVSVSLCILIFHCICVCLGNSNAKNPST